MLGGVDQVSVTNLRLLEERVAVGRTSLQSGGHHLVCKIHAALAASSRGIEPKLYDGTCTRASMCGHIGSLTDQSNCPSFRLMA